MQTRVEAVSSAAIKKIVFSFANGKTHMKNKLGDVFPP